MKKNVLIIEDEIDLAEAYSIILKADGYKVKTANDGMQALSVLEEWQADLILLDLRMPRMNGIEFLKQFKLRTPAKPKIIVFTNMDNEPEIKEAFGLGASRYMLKAWASPRHLSELVADTLSEN